MGSCAAPSAKGDDKFITTDYLQQCPYDPYCREVVKSERFTTCGGDGGCNICGGLGIFLGFLPCSPHCKPKEQETQELNGDYDFYRPIIRVKVNEI